MQSTKFIILFFVVVIIGFGGSSCVLFEEKTDLVGKVRGVTSTICMKGEAGTV